jgi:hypothetical protein
VKTFNVFIAISLDSGSAGAANFSFIGNLNHDNAVQEFNFEVEGAARAVMLRTWSFAGGTNAQGQVIADGGFDPVVSLFNSSTGALISFNDDSHLVTDPASGAAFDSLVAANLSAGNYTATVTLFGSFPVGLLTGGFTGSGYEGFGSRTSQWALDVSNVETATVGASYISEVTPVPEPDSFAMLVAGLGLLGIVARRKGTIAQCHGMSLRRPGIRLIIGGPQWWMRPFASTAARSGYSTYQMRQVQAIQLAVPEAYG